MSATEIYQSKVQIEVKEMLRSRRYTETLSVESSYLVFEILKDLERVTESFNELKHEYRTLQQRFADDSANFDFLPSKVRQLENDNQSLLTEFQNIKENYGEREETLRRESLQLQKELEFYKGMANRLLLEQTTFDTFNSPKKLMTSRSTAHLHTESDEVQRNFDMTNNELREIRQQLSTMKNCRCAELREENAKLLEELQVLQEQIAEEQYSSRYQQDEANENDYHRRLLQQENQSLHDQVRKLQALLENRHSEQQDSEFSYDRLRSLQYELDKERNSNAKLQMYWESTQDELNGLLEQRQKLQNTINHNNTQLQKYEEYKSQLLTINNNLDQRNNELFQLNSQLKDQITNQKRNILSLQSENASFASSIEQLSAELHNYKQQRDHLQNFQQENADLINENKSLLNQLSHLKSSLAQANGELHAVSSQNRELEVQIGQSQQQLSQLEKMLINVNDESKRQNAYQASQLEHRVNGLISQLEGMEKEKFAVMIQLDQQRLKYNELQDDHEQLQQQYSVLEGEIGELTRSNQECFGKIQDINGNYRRIEQANKALQRELFEKGNEISLLRQELANSEQDVQYAKQMSESVKDAERKAVLKNEGLIQENSEQAQQIANLKKQQQDCQKTIAQQTAQIHSLSEALQDIQYKYANVSDYSQQISGELNKEQQYSNSLLVQISELKDEIYYIKQKSTGDQYNQMQELQQIQTLQDELQQANEELQRYQALYEELSSEKAELKNSLTRTLEENVRVSGEQYNIAKQVSELQQKLQKAQALLRKYEEEVRVSSDQRQWYQQEIDELSGQIEEIRASSPDPKETAQIQKQLYEYRSRIRELELLVQKEKSRNDELHFQLSRPQSPHISIKDQQIEKLKTENIDLEMEKLRLSEQLTKVFQDKSLLERRLQEYELHYQYK